MSSSSIKQWFFQSAKNRKYKKKKENREKKEERYISENHNRFEIHSVRNTVRDSTVFIIISFKRGLLLEESILTKVCYGVSSRLCTGLSFCANQGVFLNPSCSCLNQDLRCFHCNFVKFIERLYWFGL